MQEYLDKVHTFRSESPERRKAERIVNVCPDIAMRPLVLSYIDLLVKEDKEYRTSREIYDAIVRNLIRREVAKEFSKEQEKREQQWFALTSLVAAVMYNLHPLQFTITQEEIEEIVNAYNEDLSDAEKVDAQKFRERSLLTRFGDEYRFSHKSFYEYLMAYRFFLDRHEIVSLQGMDFAVQIFNELVEAWQQDKEGFAIGGQTFSEAHVADSLHQMGYYLQSLNNFKEAEKDYQAALEIRHELAKKDFATYMPDLALTFNNLGLLHRRTNDYEKASNEISYSLDIYRRLITNNYTDYYPKVAMALHNLAILHYNMNDIDKAAEEYSEALKIYRDLNPETYKPEIAGILNTMGNFHEKKGNHEQAINEYVEALNTYNELSKTKPTLYEQYIAMTLNNLGISHHNNNDYIRAEEYFNKSLEIDRKLSKYDPIAYEPYIAMVLNNLGKLHCDMKQYKKAEDELNKSMEIRRRLSTNNPKAYRRDLALTLGNLACFHLHMHNYSKSKEEYDTTLDIFIQLSRFNPNASYTPQIAGTLYNIALLHESQGHFSEAKKYASWSHFLYQGLANRCHEAFDRYERMSKALLTKILQEKCKN